MNTDINWEVLTCHMGYLASVQGLLGIKHGPMECGIVLTVCYCLLPVIREQSRNSCPGNAPTHSGRAFLPQLAYLT